jgi:hypothetical protein
MSHPPEHIVRLTSVPTEREAAIIVAALDESGIPSTMSGQFTAGFRAEAPGWVQVLVAKEDLARAQEILARLRAEQDEVDWSQVDVGQPEEPAYEQGVSHGWLLGVIVAVGLAIAIALVLLAGV